MPASVNPGIRPRALTISQHSTPSPAGQDQGMKPKHVRATSEAPCLMSRGRVLHSPGSITRTLGEVSTPNEHRAVNHHFSPTSSGGIKELDVGRQPLQWKHDEGLDSTEEEADSRDHAEDPGKGKFQESVSQQEQPEARPAPMGVANSFLDIGGDRIGQTREDDEASSAAIFQEASKDAGFTFDDLVDRLLAQPKSKSDGKFASIFLCLYRKFAAPSELVTALINRFQLLNDGSHPQILRTTSQLRYLAVLAHWVSEYPGDFAHSQTRQVVTSFVSRLSGTRASAVAGKEIGSCLEIVSADDDTEWACSDNSRSRANTLESFLSMSSVQSTASTLNADSSTEDVLATASADVPAKQQHARNSATPSLSSSIGRSETQSTGSFQTLLNLVENAQRQAQFLSPVPRKALTKIQWHQLMDTADEDVARELTRIDWIMFSSIRPRDLVRHVSLPSHEKGKCKSLEHVNRLIGQFNHVAYWVANLILLRDKPKHRAKMLEKFMSIAWVSQASEHAGRLLMSVVEITSAEQLQLIGCYRRWHQWHSRSPAGADTGACPASSAKAVHAFRDTYGHTEKPFRVSAGLGQYIL